MNWTIPGDRVDPCEVADFTPVDVLADYDGPRTFTVRGPAGRTMLAHWLDEDGRAARYLVVPVRDAQVADLRRGDAAVRAVLDQAVVVVVEVSHVGGVEGVWRTTFADIPADTLPASDVTLSRRPPVVTGSPITPFRPSRDIPSAAS